MYSSYPVYRAHGGGLGGLVSGFLNKGLATLVRSAANILDKKNEGSTFKEAIASEAQDRIKQIVPFMSKTTGKKSINTGRKRKRKFIEGKITKVSTPQKRAKKPRKKIVL